MHFNLFLQSPINKPNDIHPTSLRTTVMAVMSRPSAVDSFLANCMQTLPETALQRISTFYRRKVAPRPKICNHAYLRTVAPVVTKDVRLNSGWGGGYITHVCHRYTMEVGERIFVFTVKSVNQKFQCIDIEEMQEIGHSLPRMVNYGALMGSKNNPFLYISSKVEPKTSLPIYEVLEGLALVAKRYDRDLLSARFSWWHATRKQKTALRFMNDMKKT
jgi:hypothetical protein